MLSSYSVLSTIVGLSISNYSIWLRISSFWLASSASAAPKSISSAFCLSSSTLSSSTCSFSSFTALSSFYSTLMGCSYINFSPWYSLVIASCILSFMSSWRLFFDSAFSADWGFSSCSGFAYGTSNWQNWPSSSSFTPQRLIKMFLIDCFILLYGSITVILPSSTAMGWDSASLDAGDYELELHWVKPFSIACRMLSWSSYMSKLKWIYLKAFWNFICTSSSQFLRNTFISTFILFLAYLDVFMLVSSI